MVFDLDIENKVILVVSSFKGCYDYYVCNLISEDTNSLCIREVSYGRIPVVFDKAAGTFTLC
jgi:hypothetical protein